jgi:MoaA/NifB/PqqE/SkfB family radical SAM enzyme
MHCRFCPSDELGRAKGHLDDEMARRFLEAAPEFGGQILFNVVGEPLLNNKLFEYIAIAEAHNIPVFIVTNMTLLTEERMRRLCSFSNVSLGLSVQTSTTDSFKTRGYNRISSFEEYMEIACQALEAKFKYRSRMHIDVYLASELPQDAVDSDFGRLWTLYSGQAEFAAGEKYCVERLTRLSEELKQKYPEMYEEELQRVLVQLEGQVVNGQLVREWRKLPPPGPNSDFYRWMCIPGVFVSYKAFTLWARQDRFLRKHILPHQVLYTEERSGDFPCPGTGNFGVLSNGEYTLCCRDTDGEMGIGNIREMTPQEAMASPRRAELMANAAACQLCRRCLGKTFLLDSSPLAANVQPIDKLGGGYYPQGTDLLAGRTGRWTKGTAHAYFCSRLQTSRLSLDIYSPHAEGTRCGVLLSRWDDGSGSFVTDTYHEFTATTGCYSRLSLAVQLQLGRFYRLTLVSPTVEISGQWLGLGVAALRVEGRPVEGVELNSAHPEQHQFVQIEHRP